MSAAEWKFDKVGSGEAPGWNNPAISKFRPQRLRNLTREIIQNSLDAKSEDSPLVRVSFVETRRPRAEIPNLNALCGVLESCLRMAEKFDSEKIQKAVRRVLERASRDVIPVLSVSDTGTVGMPGPCEEGTPFHRYLKSEGTSPGEDVMRRGSHGLGKAAPLCTSALRAIVVATTWQGEGRKQEGLMQGRVTLRSRVEQGEDGEATRYTSVGYWGRDFDAIRPEECPKPYRWMTHQGGVGTTVHILGWEPGHDDWADVIVGYTASNYFTALARGMLEVVVHPAGRNVVQRVLNKDSVEGVLENRRIEATMKKLRGDTSAAKSLVEARHFYKCIVEGEGVQRKKSEMRSLGDITARLCIEEDAPCRFAIVRNGMLITSSPPYFWTRPSRELENFAGVFECESRKGNELLRDMEPPDHSSLSPDEPEEQRDKEVADDALKRMGQFMQDFVKEHAAPDVPEGDEATIMREFFADAAGEGGSGDNEPDPDGEFKIQAQPPRKSKELDPEPEPKPGPGNGGSTTGGPGPGGGGGGGDGPGTSGPGGEPAEGDGATRRRRVVAADSRVVKKGEKDGKTSVKVIVRARKDIRDATLILREVGSDDDDRDPITRNLSISLAEGEEKVWNDLTLDRKVVGGIKVLLSEEVKSSERKAS